VTPIRQLFELARRDFVTRAKSRAFLISMSVSILLVLALGPLIALTIDEDETPRATVGLVGELPIGLSSTMREQGSALGMVLSTRDFSTLSSAEAALEDGHIAALVNGTEIVWRGEPWAQLEAAMVSGYQLATRQEAVADLGLTSDDAARLFTAIPLTERLIQEPDPEDGPRRVAAYVAMMLLYVSILIFGQFVLMGVMEEKQSRVVEVVLSRASPARVLTGKVVGIGLLGLIQLVAIAAAALLGLSAVDLADVDLSSIGVSTMAWLVVWYLLGYAFYSVVYGALGATVSRQEDVQGAVMIPVLFVLPGFLFAQIALANPDTLLSQITSLVPVWSPMVMPVRATVTTVPIWEVGASMAIIVLSTVGLVRLAGRIYTGAVLRIGPKIKLRDAWRAATH
jgi:ABC-2 type transport system permease protein